MGGLGFVIDLRPGVFARDGTMLFAWNQTKPRVAKTIERDQAASKEAKFSSAACSLPAARQHVYPSAAGSAIRSMQPCVACDVDVKESDMRKIVLFVVVVAVTALGWLSIQQSKHRQPIVSGFIEADQVRVGSRVGGRVATVDVEEGQRVTKGDRLFSVDPFDLEERLAEAKALLASAQADYHRLAAGLRGEEIAQAKARRDQAAAHFQKLRSGPRPGEIQMARARLRMAQADLELAESEYARVQKLREDASAAKTEYDQTLRMRKRALAEVASAQEEVALLEQGTRSEDIASAEATLAEAESALALAKAGYRSEEVARAKAQSSAAAARVRAIEKQLDELEVFSPCGCLVEAIDLRPGDLVAPGAPSVSLLEVANLWVRTYVPQSYLGRVHVGDVLPVTVDTLGGRRFDGRVVFIASDGEFTPRNLQTPEERGKQVFRMKLMIDGDRQMLRVGMAADVLLPSGRPQ